MPQAHRQQVEWTPERFIRWAQHSGLATAQVVGRTWPFVDTLSRAFAPVRG